MAPPTGGTDRRSTDIDRCSDAGELACTVAELAAQLPTRCVSLTTKAEASARDADGSAAAAAAARADAAAAKGDRAAAEQAWNAERAQLLAAADAALQRRLVRPCAVAALTTKGFGQKQTTAGP